MTRAYPSMRCKQKSIFRPPYNIVRDTGWKVMGLGCSLGYLQALVIAVLLAAFVGESEGGCDIGSMDKCYSHYDQTKGPCVALSSYFQCINSIQDCSSSIRWRSVKIVIENSLKKRNCSRNASPLTPVGPRPVHVGPSIQGCYYTGNSPYRHCGLFGDPHLRTFDDRYQTCRVRGAWPVIDNKYLTVQVTNEPVGKHGSATATTKLTVLIKKHESCGAHVYSLYQAQTDYLPNTFSDGNSYYGNEDDRTIDIVEVESRRHIEINVRYIDTTILVRQIGRFLTFSIQMPEEFLNTNSTGSPEREQFNLCTKGCPSSELINYKQFLANKHNERKDPRARIRNTQKVVMTRDQAIEKCKRTRVIDFYFDSCVFDLMTTGDSNFTLAANSAQDDLIRFNPEVGSRLRNRTTLDVHAKPSRNHAETARTSLFAWIVFVWSFSLTMGRQS